MKAKEKLSSPVILHWSPTLGGLAFFTDFYKSQHMFFTTSTGAGPWAPGPLAIPSVPGPLARGPGPAQQHLRFRVRMGVYEI